jgi:SAM-dependent methyltransferase
VIDRAVFDDLYRGGADPWAFGSSAYEARKRALTIASLPRARYDAAFEPGCALGHLTALLARRCARLLALDVSPRAVARARRRVRAPHVAIAQGAVPEDWPDERLDLVVLSELGYFLDAAELDAVAERCADGLVPGGDLVAVHWRGPIEGYPLDGADVHARLAELPELARSVRHEEPDFLLEVFRRR